MILHREAELVTRRHMPSWALFAFAAGAVNAGALLACQRFVAHVTGTVTRIGVDAGGVLALDYALVLVTFIAGAMAAVLLVRKAGAKTPAYWLPLLVVSSILVVVAIAGSFGKLGAFGGSVETAHDFALLAVLSFAMGMQNAAVATSTGMAIRTTHMTGPTTDMAVAFGTLLSSDATEEERAKAKQSVFLRGTKLVSFILGGVAMAFLAPRVTWLAFLVPAAAGFAATVRSYLFVDSSEGDSDVHVRA
jgi:uncharacterized membrane protein YoaK (UPF0700 family)